MPLFPIAQSPFLQNSVPFTRDPDDDSRNSGSNLLNASTTLGGGFIVRDSVTLSSSALDYSSPLAHLKDRADTLLASLREIVADARIGEQGQADQQSRIDAALIELGSLFSQEVRFGGAANAQILNRNSSQLSRAEVLDIRPTAKFTVQGEVVEAADQARLVILGDSSGEVKHSATILITGDSGETTIDMNNGESLADVAARINQQGDSIGVIARAAGNTLTVESLNVGSDATLQIEQISGGVSQVSGVNSAQVSSVETVTAEAGASETLAGTITSTASGASARYLGDAGGLTAGAATFRLSGNTGNATISIADGEALDDVADRVNAATANTGVTAYVSGDELFFASEGQGANAFVQVDVLDLNEQVTTTGANAGQVVQVVVTSIVDGSQEVLSGQVLQTAEAAELTLSIGQAGNVVDNSTFQLTGDLGVRSYSASSGELLGDVVTRINADTASTGIAATLSGDDILLSSSDLGAAATVEVALINVDHETIITGVNSQQLSDFQVQSFTDGAQHSISGTITQAADVAELTYTGIGVLVASNSTFTLTGDNGSVAISTLVSQTLSDLADDINSHTATTGVRASLNGSTISLRSQAVGSAADVEVDVTSGAFNVSGGNGNGTANGIDATATINGQNLTAAGNTFTLADAFGSYTLTAVQGYTGGVDSISLDSQAGQFAVTGGNGDGTANGIDASATINGQQLSSSDNRFTISTTNGVFDVDFQPGFSGVFDSITVSSSVSDFQLADVDGNGRAIGADAVATLNGVQLTGDGNRFTVNGAAGVYRLDIVDGFTGQIDPITISTSGSAFDFFEDDDGVAQGRDTRAIINGQVYTGRGQTLTISDSQLEIELQFAAGFVGLLDDLVVEPQLVLAAPSALGPSSSGVQSAFGELLELGRGGLFAVGQGGSEEARQRIDRFTDEIGAMETSQSSGVSDRSLETTSAQSITRAAIVADQFQTLSAAQKVNFATLLASQQASLIDLLG